MKNDLSKYNSKLYNDLSAITDTYVKKFEKKHGYQFEYEIGVYKNETCNFGDCYFFSLADIIYDIETKQPKGLIYKWIDDTVAYVMNHEDKIRMNFKSYSKGLRYEHLKQIK